jgi:hypothetical protein
MLRFLKLIVLVPLAVLVGLISLANREAVTLSFDPLVSGNPALSVSAPLFVVLFLTLLLGVLLGGIGAWLGQGKWRRAARRRSDEVDQLRAEIRQKAAEGENRQLAGL